MCGIGGALERDPARDGNIDLLLKSILEDQRPRGPDHQSLVHFDRDNVHLSLTHNRLAILDLTDNANQPYVDQATGSCVVFNGEIYNYIELRDELRSFGVQFYTNSDTEVLLRAYLRWGNEAFKRFNGMFALAIFDPKERKLVLVRDRFGVKPCYYFDKGQTIAFASTTAALAKFYGLKLDYEYLSRGILYNLYEDNSNSTAFGGIKSVPPGHILEVQGGQTRLIRFYSLTEDVNDELENIRGLSEPQLVALLEERLHSAVHVRLRSDVPLTVSLSGGLDSALLSSLMIEERNRPREAFTLGTLDDRNAEAHLANASAIKTGLSIHFVEVDNEKICDLFERTLAAQGAPFAHPSVMSQFRIFEEMNKLGYKVSIGGQGADEVFLGYRKFQLFYLRELIQGNQWSKLARSTWGVMQMLFAELSNPKKLWMYQKRYSRPRPTAPFLNADVKPLPLSISGYDSFLQRQIADIGPASLATLLRYEDRNSMGNSIESRLPFLDYRVVRLGVALPIEMKIRNGYGKWILRKIAAKRLPEQIVYKRSKLAFSLDSGAWMNCGLSNHLFQKIQPNLKRIEPLLTPSAIEILSDKSTYYDPTNFPLLVTARFAVDCL